MSRSSNELLAKFLATLPKRQNLVITFLLANFLSLGVGLLVGQLMADGKVLAPGSSKSQTYSIKDTATATVSAPAQVLPSASLGKSLNINSASFQELDYLPGIGPVYAQKIISGRPYAQVSELITKKIIPVSTYNKIKDRLSAQ